MESKEVNMGSNYNYTIHLDSQNSSSLAEDMSDNSIAKDKRLEKISEEKIKRILLVEDDEITQDVIILFLKDIYQVDIAADTASAIDAVKKKNYAAVLMDINLGRGKSGIEVTKEIRKMPDCEHLPIIAVTAFASKGDKEEFLAAGCNYYIAKPFSKEEIRNLLASIRFRQ